MINIRLTEFKGYTEEMFLQYLRCHGTSFITILIPKDFDDEEPGLLVQDYLRALYTGQLLGRLSEDVMHSIPDPAKPGQFSFIIATARWEELAGLLVYLYKSFDWDDHLDDYLAFGDCISRFLEKADEDEEITCPYFLDVIDEYS